MPNIIKIKRKPQANGAGVPNALVAGELAFSEADAKLFYGLDTAGSVSPIEIGGSGYVLSKIASSAGSGLNSTGTGNSTVLNVGAGDGISVSADTVAVDSSVIRAVGNQSIGGSMVFQPANGYPGSVTFTDNTEGGMGVYIQKFNFNTGTSVGNSLSLTVDNNGSGKYTTLTTSSPTSDITVVLPSGAGTLARLSDITSTRLDQLSVPTGDVSFNNRKITNLGTPTADADAATKAYVDAARSGLDVKQSVRVATTQAFNAGLSVTYSGNTISGTNVGTIPAIDGVTLVNGDRILVKNETGANQPYNGIYVVSSVGSAGSPWILTRATDADSSAEVTAGMFTFVAEGTNNADSGWVLTTNDNITLGTTNLAFAQFSGAGQVSAVSGLAKNGNNIGLATAYGDTINPFGSKTQYNVLAAPTGAGGGVPSFRLLVAGDLPSIGNISNAGAIGSTTNRPIITTTNGVLTTGTFGSAASTFCEGNDSRLSDTRNTTNSLTVNNAGAGDASSFTFNGSAGRTLSYNSIGAPSISGANATGTWNISINGNSTTVTSGVYTNRSITINGTTNQITSSAGAQDLSANRTWTLSLPQDIHTGASPTFTGITLNGTVNARAAASASAATQIPVFTGDPSSTTRGIVTRTPAQLLSDIGAYAANNPNGYTSNAGTVTSVTAGSGMNFTSISSSGPVTLGTPSSITLATTNSLTANSHTHAFAPGGTTAQYIRGDGTLATTPVVNDATLTLNVSGTGLSGSQTFTANQSTGATFTVTSNATPANTASTIVARDASNNFSAGTITATLNGNASTVTSGVYTSGSYADPSWITSLAKSKVGLANVENTALSTWAGSTNITTLGTISAGTWSATTIAVDKGGTGQTTYTNGQLLIGNSTGNTLTKATLTQGTGLVITNGTGSITIAHNDTSSLNGLQGGNGISSVTVDNFGHVTAVGTATYLTSATVCSAIADCTIDGGTFS